MAHNHTTINGVSVNLIRDSHDPARVQVFARLGYGGPPVPPIGVIVRNRDRTWSPEGSPVCYRTRAEAAGPIVAEWQWKQMAVTHD